MTAITHAEQLLQELGIETAADIDVEAIAFTQGARVRFRPLDGCEARVIGRDNQAIITVNSRSAARRQRFSIAHELGHWRYHKRKILVCRTEDIESRNWSAVSPERTADSYAADLLMPWFLFRPVARRLTKLTFEGVRQLADIFDVSIEAAAIRLVESKLFSSILICHTLHGRKWFRRSPDVPERWFPQDELDHASYAFDILQGTKGDDSMPHKIGADAWFDRSEAQYYNVQEQTIQIGPGRILTLLGVSHDRMLEER